MVILVISVSSNLSEDSVGTPAGRVILFGTIPTTILDTTPIITPPTTQTDITMIPVETPIIALTISLSPDYTPSSPDYLPVSETESDPSEDLSSGHIPPLLAVSPFLSSDDDTTDSDTPDTPPSLTYSTPFTKITASTQRSPVIPRRRVMILAPGQPIPYGRPHSLLDHSSSDLPSTSAESSRKRRRSLMTSIFALPLVSRALSPVCVVLIPSPTRVRDISYLADVEVGPRETRVERVTHPATPKDIPEPAQEGAVEVTYETLGDLAQMFHDHTQAIPVHRIQVIEGVQREQGYKIVGVESAVTTLTERVAKLERDNRRLRGTASVKSPRVDQLYAMLLRCRKMPNTQSEASMTHEEVKELVAHRVAEEIEARKAATNLKTLNENADEQEVENGGNENRGNGGNRDNGGNENGGNVGNGNEGNGENGNHGMNYGGFMPIARTFHDFLKCKPHTFSGTKGIVGLTRWFKKMETVFNIINFPLKNEIQKMETKLWNLTVKGNDLTGYTQRFYELILLCTRMVPDEEDRVERFIGGLPDNIQGNVIAVNLARLQDAIRIANQLIDKKLQGYAARSAENKKRMERNPRDNRIETVRRLGTRLRIVRKDCPKLRSQNHGNQKRNKTRNKIGGNEVTAKAYPISGGGTNPDSNVVTGMFLLNNCYASMLIDSGADRSFVSTIFSALLEVTPSTLA
nr:hypothetical protein [Tanacetum cinerariifolium]